MEVYANETFENRCFGRMSVHADLLHDRHTSGSLAAIVPEEDFTAADFFLFLQSELAPQERGPHWFGRHNAVSRKESVRLHDLRAEVRLHNGRNRRRSAARRGTPKSGR